MKSKVAKKMQGETPKEVRAFVRQYTDTVLRTGQKSAKGGYSKDSDRQIGGNNKFTI